ncbi:MAG: menaquinol oxidoreductase [Geoalkalibacter sp.]|uniref:menaquinol oxidoreductase n=1 Tax=Geoalkalibacter sp. TaxID=3041440 RepID=UPI003D09EE2D
MHRHRKSAENSDIAPAKTREQGLERIRKLQSVSRRGLWGLAIFLGISMVALPQAGVLPTISRNVREMLGAAPPTNLISIALVVYSFSALVLILSRIGSGNGSYRGWSHLGYLSAFYAFYYYADALDSNFWAIFAAGFTILSLEHYHIWTFCRENIRKEKEHLKQLERKEAFFSSSEQK